MWPVDVRVSTVPLGPGVRDPFVELIRTVAAPAHEMRSRTWALLCLPFHTAARSPVPDGSRIAVPIRAMSSSRAAPVVTSTTIGWEPSRPPTRSRAVRPSADQSASTKPPAFRVTFREKTVRVSPVGPTSTSRSLRARTPPSLVPGPRTTVVR